MTETEKQPPSFDNMTKLEAALEWARRGFFIFPCRPDKSPATGMGGCWHATRDEKKIREWWRENPNFEIAVHPGLSGHAVIDVDPPSGELTLAALPNLPTTFETRTPRGGRHIWFRGGVPSKTKALGEGVDTRGEGGYVLVPPSVGGLYYVTVDETFADLPSWVSDALSRKAHEKSTITRPPPLEVVKEALHHIDPGADRDTWRNTVAAIRSCGEYMDLALAWSRGEYHGSVPANYTGDEAVAVVWDTMEPTVGGVGPGTLFHYARGGGWKGNTVNESTIKAKVFPGPRLFRDVLTDPVVPLNELIGGLVEKGIVTFLSAPGGAHKSRIALQMGLSLADSKQFLGLKSEHATFLNLSYEDSAAEVGRRAHLLKDKLHITGENAFYWDLQSKDEPLLTVYEDGEIERHAMATHLRRWCREVAGHKLIAIDSTYNAVRFAGNAKVNESSVMRAIGALQGIAEDNDASILMLWHPSQAGMERGDASGWSVAWHNAPRARLSITAGDDDWFTLRVEKRNHGQRGPDIHLRYDNGAMVTGDPDAELMATVREQVAHTSGKGAPLNDSRLGEDWLVILFHRHAKGAATKKFVTEAFVKAVSRGILERDASGGFKLV